MTCCCCAATANGALRSYQVALRQFRRGRRAADPDAEIDHRRLGVGRSPIALVADFCLAEQAQEPAVLDELQPDHAARVHHPAAQAAARPGRSVGSRPQESNSSSRRCRGNSGAFVEASFTVLERDFGGSSMPMYWPATQRDWIVVPPSTVRIRLGDEGAPAGEARRRAGPAMSSLTQRGAAGWRPRGGRGVRGLRRARGRTGSRRGRARCS